MSFLKTISSAIDALSAGKQLTKSSEWKNRQNTTNALIGFIGAVTVILGAFGVTIPMSATDLANLAGGIAVILGLFNSYITTATTSKVGVKKLPKSIVEKAETAEIKNEVIQPEIVVVENRNTENQKIVKESKEKSEWATDSDFPSNT